MFQKNPRVLAIRTWYLLGTKYRFIIVPAGQNFQLVQMVSHNFYRQVLKPLAKVLKSL